MLDHHLQRGIVYKLALEDNLRFSDLKPETIENKLFTYHLKKVLTAGYVSKNQEGKYTLTAEGRRLGIRVLNDFQDLADKAHSVIFLVIRRKSDSAWLLYKRKAQPLLGKVGFMHCTPNAEESVFKTATRICKERTNIECDFIAKGNGYFRIKRGEELESFTHFTLMVCEDAKGELKQGNEYSEYFWSSSPDFNDDSMIPNMPILVEKYKSGKNFFIDQTIQL